MTPEKRLTNAIVKRLAERQADGDKIWWLKVHGGAQQRAGIPDLIICHNGHFIGLEVKIHGKNASPLQTHEIMLISSAGGTATVVRSVAEVEEALALNGLSKCM